MLSLQQLQVFVACAEQGSFSAAARALGKAQSVISQSIANLEIDLGQPLFDRSTRKPTLTPQGQRLLAHAQATLVQSQQLTSVAKALAIGDESELTLVADPALLLPALYRLLDLFQHQFPATNLCINVSSSDKIPNLIMNQQAQLGLMLIDTSMPTEVELGFLGQLPFYTIAHPDHPLSQLSSVSRADLALHRQLLPSGYEGQNKLLPVISPDAFRSNDFEVLMKMAEHNFGWGYLPAHLVEESLAQRRLTRLPVNFDIKTWTLPVDRVMALNVAKGPALSWLAEATESLLDD